MDEMFYRKSMEAEGISPNAIATRISKGNKVEEILKVSMDIVVASDDLMYNSLLILKQNENPRNAPLSNSLRKYYLYKNKRDFPRLQNYKSNHSFL